MRFALIALLALAACKSTGSECRRYIRLQNECSRDLGNEAVLPALSADITCAALNLPGIASTDLRDEFTCLADAYADADCTSDETFSATFSATCDVDEGDSDTL